MDMGRKEKGETVVRRRLDFQGRTFIWAAHTLHMESEQTPLLVNYLRRSSSPKLHILDLYRVTSL